MFTDASEKFLNLFYTRSFAFYFIYYSLNWIYFYRPGSVAPFGRIPPFMLNFYCSFFTNIARSTPRFAGIEFAIFLLYYSIYSRITLSAFLFGTKSIG